jgi:HTH-type transcriptional regulator/antitoxin HigA
MNQFKPDIIIPPGETINECRASIGISTERLALSLGLGLDATFGLFFGSTPITPEIAARLEELFSVPASFWLNLEANYRTQIE